MNETELEVQKILLDQMMLLAKINRNIGEPELVANNVLVMVEIAKIIPSYQEKQEFDV